MLDFRAKSRSTRTARPGRTRSLPTEAALAVAALAAAALVALPRPASAANAAILETTVTALPDEVSLNRSGLVSYASYRVTVRNTGGNTVNQIVVTATTTVTDAPPATTAGYVAAIGGNCTAPPAATDPPVAGATCTIGQLATNAESTFYLLFRAPEAGSKIHFNAHLDFSAGNSSNTPPAADTPRDVAVDTLLITPTSNGDAVSTKVRTALPMGGGRFFTGFDGIATNAGKAHTTTVVVPSANVYTTNEIVELDSVAPFHCTSTSPRYSCFGLSTKITISDVLQSGATAQFPAPYIAITLRQDATSVATLPGTKVADVKIFYTPDPRADNPTPITEEVLACSAGTTALPLPRLDHPCIVDGGRIAYKSGKGVPAGFEGDFEFHLIAVDNGSFSW